MINIDKPIVHCAVVNEEAKKETVTHVERESVLDGKTYKISKSPLSESALYVTLNNHNGSPFEIFLNSKDTRHHQWIVALTRVISAVFRKGGDCTFLIEELKSIYDPNGGYFKKGKYIPSLVAEIGNVLEEHFIDLGLHEKDESLAVAAQAMVKEKMEKKPSNEEKMLICPKCGQKSALLLDNCLTCVTNPECGFSRCG